MFEKEPDEQVHVTFTSERDDEAHWEVTRMGLREGFDEPYAIDLDLRSDDFHGLLHGLLGARAEVGIERGGMRRVMFGIVERVEDGPWIPEHVAARVRVSPALSASKHRRNSRMFTDMTVVEVLRAVLEPTLQAFDRELDIGWLSRDYPQRELFTQYQESDFDFASRLMEDAGIFYRFDHGEDAETLIVLDDDSGYTKLNTAGGPEGLLPMVSALGGSNAKEGLSSFARKVRITANVARAASFDWRTPDDDAGLGGDGLRLGLNAGGPDLEDYDFDLPPVGAGTEAVERKLELRQRRINQAAQTFVGRTTATQLAVGSTFEVIDHPDGELNGEYLVTAVKHQAERGDRALLGAPAFGGPPDPVTEAGYGNEFEAVPLHMGWCPRARAERPKIQGVVTATVVGSELAASEAGRVRLQFPWDRSHAGSCSVPVVQPWAGENFGVQFMPRAGMRVVVAFLDGNPDQPVVTGCLYDGKNTPPYDPSGPRSGIKTKTVGADTYNELAFVDDPGAELIEIHAQKDMTTEVLQEHRLRVGTDDHTNVAGEQRNTVTGNQFETYKANQQVRVAGAHSHTVGGTDLRKVEKKATEIFRDDVKRDIAGNLDDTIEGRQTISAHGEVLYKCRTNREDRTQGEHTITADGGLVIKARDGVKITAPGGLTVIGPTTDSQVYASRTEVTASTVESIVELVNLAVLKRSVTMLNLSLTGTSIGVKGFDLSNSAVDLGEVATSFKSEVTALRQQGLSVAEAVLKIIS